MQNAQKMQKVIKTLKIFSSFFALSAIYKIHIFGAADRHAPVQYAKYIFFFFFFLSIHHDTNPLLHLYHFRKKYNYTLANIYSESSRVIFSFFLSSSIGPRERRRGRVVRAARLWCRKSPYRVSSRLGCAMRRLENSLCQPSRKWVPFSN